MKMRNLLVMFYCATLGLMHMIYCVSVNHEAAMRVLSNLALLTSLHISFRFTYLGLVLKLNMATRRSFSSC